MIRLRVRRKPEVQLADPATFQRLVSHLFSRRRKTLRNSLRGVLSEAELEGLGIDPNARPQTLDVTAFAALANAVHGAEMRG
jgi:16S rRNA (adenine1518-N6/adenine1519-N6)-dimethyltransferase